MPAPIPSRACRLPRPRVLAVARSVATLSAVALALPAALPAQDASASAAATAQPLRELPAREVVAFVDVTVVPMDRERLLAHQTVVVRDGKIAAMGPVGRTAVPAGARRVDGRGKFLAPGLVDMHAHVAPGTEDLADGAGRQLALYLATGFTTVRGLSNAPSAIALRDRVRRGEVLGPTLVLSGASLNGKSVTSPAAAVRLVEEQKAAGYELLKTHGQFASGEVYDSLVAAAGRAGLRLVGHVTPEFGLARAMAAGQQVEHLDGYLAASLPEGVPAPPGQFILDPAVLDRVDTTTLRALAVETARRKIWNGPTLALFEVVAGDVSPDSLAARPEMRYAPPQAVAAWTKQKADMLAQMPPEGRRRYLALRERLVRELHAAGAKLLVGSDSPQLFMTPGFGGLREMDALVRAGLSPYAALEAATRNPAEYLGRAGEVGTVAPGMRADLVLLDRDPLAAVAALHHPAGVMVDGRWLPRERLDALLAAVASRLR